jgi:hypothetical protein
MSVDLDERTYIRELEDSLQLILFGDGGNATAVVLLVRSALSAGDRPKAERLASAAQHLTEATLVKSDMAAAACHVRGLIERNADLLQQAADQYAGTASPIPSGGSWNSSRRVCPTGRSRARCSLAFIRWLITCGMFSGSWTYHRGCRWRD